MVEPKTNPSAQVVVFKAAAILAVALLALEGLFRLCTPNIKVFMFKGDTDTVKTLLQSSSPFVRKAFCDPVHQTSLGERMTASCVDRTIRDILRRAERAKTSLWVTGASSTLGNNCESGTSWPEELHRIYPGIRLRNLATDTAVPADSFAELEHLFSRGEFPGVLLWTNGGHIDPQIEIPGDSPLAQRLFLKLLYFDFYLLMKSRLYDFLRLHSSEWLHRWFPPKQIHLSHPLWEKLVQDSMNRQEHYLEDLARRARERHFDLVCVRVPAAQGTFPGSFIHGREAYDAHLERMSERTRTVCARLGIPYADVQACYASMERE